jgi:hypothetical protein
MVNIALDRILQASIDDIGKDFLEELFAPYHDKESGVYKQAQFDPNSYVQLTPDKYRFVKSNTTTTLGMLFFNRYCLERTQILQHMPYWNMEITAKSLEQLDTAVNNLVIQKIIDTIIAGSYFDAREHFGFWCSAFTSVSISPALVMPMADVTKRKKELFKHHHEALSSDNAVDQIMAVNQIEKELIGMVEKNLQKDIGYDFFASGDGNLDNNYKTINVMRGAVFNHTTKKYDVVQNSLMEGVTQKDIVAFANSIVAGAYPSAIGTADAGYAAKKILALLQSEHIDPNPNSDCGSTATIPLTITHANKQYVLYRNILHNKKLVAITLNNINDFVGQTVYLYTPMGCLKDAICGKCAGMIFHNLGVTQIGLLVTQITMKMLNLKLKAKHDLSQSAAIIPEEFLFADKNEYAGIHNKTLRNKVHMKLYIPRFYDRHGDDATNIMIQSTYVDCLGIFPVKFFDNNGKELMSTMMTVPAMMSFRLYNDLGETADHYIISYDPESEVCRMDIQQSIANVEAFINQIYLESKIPQIPYNLLTEMMFRCLSLNRIDLTGPSITYEILARRVCRAGHGSFAKAFGKNPVIDPMSYTKLPFRQAVQEAGILQGILFEDIGASINKGLSMTLNNIPTTSTPLEKIIRA